MDTTRTIDCTHISASAECRTSPGASRPVGFMVAAGPRQIFPEVRHVGYWTEVSAVLADRRRLERPRPCVQDVRPGVEQGQVEDRVLLAEGLHVRVPDRDRRVRQ